MMIFNRRRRHKPILFEQLKLEQRAAAREAAGKLPGRIMAYNLTMQVLGFCGKVFATLLLSLAVSVVGTAIVQGQSPLAVAGEWWRWLVDAVGGWWGQ